MPSSTWSSASPLPPRLPARRRSWSRSVRPSPVTIDDAATDVDDVDRWLEASDVAADHGIELLEWYVVGPTGIVCPREAFGEPPRWPAG